MTTARSAIAPVGSAGYYHCVSRCVRRAWLCGEDRLSGKSYDHRRDWLVERVNELALIFGERVLAYAAFRQGGCPRACQGVSSAGIAPPPIP